ncbi:Tex family protein [Heliophilum fasciatum]
MPWESPVAPRVAADVEIALPRVQAAIELLDEGNTIPFIARYRKERTMEMDEVQLRALAERLAYVRNLDGRKADVYRLVQEMGKLDDGWVGALKKASSLAEVEDLYRPFRPKRKTRASVAREKGLGPLAEVLLAQVCRTYEPATALLAQNPELLTQAPDVLAAAYVSEERDVADAAAALAGALDIIAEEIADHAEMRRLMREKSRQKGELVVQAVDKAVRGPYEMYYDYRERVARIPAHRTLAINRGEREKVLSVKLEVPVPELQQELRTRWLTRPGAPAASVEAVGRAIDDAYKRLIAPAIERELRAAMTEQGEEQAIKVFAANLRPLLLQQPVRGRVVMGFDPGYRTGCKLAVVDETGKLAEVATIYPHQPQNKRSEAQAKLVKLIERHHVAIVAIGNGTASRESEVLVAETIRDLARPVQYTMVSEAGASVYSASPLAAEEFPELDVSLRSAISIARRLQDPLAELVKIEPKSIGVGQYQHDVEPKRLDQALTGVVEDCVNAVGVDLNTASPSLLSYVAGVKPAIAKNIVAYREAQGRFRKRNQLLKVPRLGPAAYTQCAGFVRIPGGDDPLENTPIHPEAYQAAQKLLQRLGVPAAVLSGSQASPEMVKLRQALAALDIPVVAAELGIGVPTLTDIVAALSRPGRDPREDLPKPSFRTDVLEMKDLQVGMTLTGTVSNVVDFGAFVDIGVKQDGLVHVSQLAERFVRHPLEVVSVGQPVTVRVIGVELERGRISLSMRPAE